MPKKAAMLKAKQVEHLPPGIHAVGGVDGLLIRVHDSGTKYWLLRYATPEVRYSKAGKPYRARRDLGIGPYPEIGLAQARDKARDYRHRIREYGEDPAAQRQAAHRQWAESLRRGITFEEAARKAFKAKAPEFRSRKHQENWIGALEVYAFPVIGNVPVVDVANNHILQVLEPIWYERTETASRVRQRMESVLTWATVSELRTGNNPAMWRGNLKELLPAPNKIKPANHFPSLPWRQLPEFMASLSRREGFSARALEFAIFTGARSGEVRGAMWDEIDLKNCVWTVPAERTKNGKQHRVPLNDRTTALLEGMPEMEGDPHVFPAQRGGAMSDMSLTALIRRMNKAEGDPWIDPTTGRHVTVHGFRSTFKDWCREMTRYPDEVSELQLAHISDDKTRAAYARSELLDRRRELMERWEQFCIHGQPGTEDNVTLIREATE